MEKGKIYSFIGADYGRLVIIKFIEKNYNGTCKIDVLHDNLYGTHKEATYANYDYVDKWSRKITKSEAMMLILGDKKK